MGEFSGGSGDLSCVQILILMLWKQRYSELNLQMIKDTLKEDKPPNKGQVKSTLVYTLYRKSPLKEDNLSTKDKMAGPKGVLIKRFHCTPEISLSVGQQEHMEENEYNSEALDE